MNVRKVTLAHPIPAAVTRFKLSKYRGNVAAAHQKQDPNSEQVCLVVNLLIM